jgi:hypothetical protein
MGSKRELKAPLSEDLRQWRYDILKGYLGTFFCKPFPKDQQAALAAAFVKDKSNVISLITPNERTMKQAGACFLLSFGREVEWFACSSHELIRSFFDSDSTI